MKKTILTALALSAALLPVAHAEVVKVEYQVNIWAKYDASLGRYVQFSPISGLGYFQYDDAYSSISNSPSSTYANFGLQSSYATYPYGSSSPNKMVSPVTQYVPVSIFDSFSTNISVSMNSSSSYPGMYPSPSTTVTASTYASKYDSQAMLQYSYNQSISMPVPNNDLNGDGVSDFGLIDHIKLFDFWTRQIGSTYAFNESYSAYSAYSPYSPYPVTGPYPNGSRVGESWYGDFSITSVKNIPYEPFNPYPGYLYPAYIGPLNPSLGLVGMPAAVNVPEPATALLVGLGLFGFSMSRRRTVI